MDSVCLSVVCGVRGYFPEDEDNDDDDDGLGRSTAAAAAGMTPGAGTQLHMECNATASV